MDDLEADYVLGTDLDLNRIDFEPIGGTFSGRFDGDGHSIYNLTIDRPDESSVGLFRRSVGDITHLHLSNVAVTGGWAVGGLLGVNGISPEGDLEGGIGRVRLTGSVVGTGTGGVCGVNSGGVSQCSSDVTVRGSEIGGGIVGVNSFAAVITDSYATGATCGEEIVGGVTGVNQDFALVSRAYASGSVSGPTVGGVVGENDLDGTVGATYWNSEIVTTGVGAGPTGQAVGLTTDQMTGSTAPEHMTTFDWETVWRTTDEYPRLQWEPVAVVPDPIDRLHALQRFIESLGLPRGLERRLLAMLRVVERLVARGTTPAPRVILRAFGNLVWAQRGKQIDSPTADALIATATKIADEC